VALGPRLSDWLKKTWLKIVPFSTFLLNINDLSGQRKEWNGLTRKQILNVCGALLNNNIRESIINLKVSLCASRYPLVQLVVQLWWNPGKIWIL